ncbi:hypothetical protein N7508_006805 [Penicillium antarcticum]|uniref:uncharacterized protein n=1 Tax=Penicillium antarcticum TaxID=416450 RepID=UPI00238FE523|nr:uncharacterized protein N7508_006805 [Penicillium antarcticum]KAJ5301942.1 hypothetical protein N7508_006805 [Penicillium antarcticum]
MDGRDSEQRCITRRGNRKIMWLMAFPGVCRASAVQGKGLHCCAGSFPGDGDSPSDEDGDDDSNGSNDYG